MSNLPEKSPGRKVAHGTAGAIEWGGTALGIVACLVVWFQVLPPLLQTGTMALGLTLIAVGFGAFCFSFADLINEGREDPKAVPVLAVRFILTLAFNVWVLGFLLNGSALLPWSSNLVLLGGCFILLILFLASSTMQQKVSQVARDETELSGNLDRIRSKASRLEDEHGLSGTDSSRATIAKLCEELRFVSPSSKPEAWDVELEILQALTDLAGIPATTRSEKLERLLILVRNRRKIHE